MTRYFRLLEDIIDENKLTTMRIYNMDESSVSVVLKHCQKILCLKGKRQIGSKASAERGTNTTV
ncbi:tigger transposable element-derived protein 6, partial [Biomphalaria glabrata]